MKFRRISDESECACDLLSLPKASEEKKKIAASYFVARQMALCGSSLAEDRTPSCGACDRIAAQIRIEMRAVRPADVVYVASREVFDNLRDGRTSRWKDFRVGRRRTGIRNGKRTQLSVKDWAGASAVRRIESLAAEYEFHVICEETRE